jgi:hypothetical protein
MHPAKSRDWAGSRPRSRLRGQPSTFRAGNAGSNHDHHSACQGKQTGHFVEALRCQLQEQGLTLLFSGQVLDCELSPLFLISSLSLCSMISPLGGATDFLGTFGKIGCNGYCAAKGRKMSIIAVVIVVIFSIWAN